MSGAVVAAVVLGGAVGASVASFLAVAVDRVPRGEPLTGRSHCVCGQLIGARDNIPILGFLVRRGRARCCGARIPWWYPAFEVAGALVGAGIALLLT